MIYGTYVDRSVNIRPEILRHGLCISCKYWFVYSSQILTFKLHLKTNNRLIFIFRTKNNFKIVLILLFNCFVIFVCSLILLFLFLSSIKNYLENVKRITLINLTYNRLQPRINICTNALYICFLKS